MPSIQQKEIVLLPFPFSDLKCKKVRPALVISNNQFNKKSDDCVMLPLTAVIKNEPYSVLIEQKDLSTGKLAKQSRIRADKIFSVEKGLVVMKIGKLRDKAFKQVKKELVKIFN
jgi:mRNA interferase MazF